MTDTKLYTTLKAIRQNNPCEDGWQTLIKHLGKTRTEAKHDETPLAVLTVLDANGVDDAIWVVDNVIKDPFLSRYLGACCAEMVLHIFEAECPGDSRVRDCITVAKDPNSTAAAWDAARGAAQGAARDAAWDAARAAARAAAWAAARAAARDAAWAAAWAAARAAAWAAAGAAARDAAWAAAGDALRDRQSALLREHLLNKGLHLKGGDE